LTSTKADRIARKEWEREKAQQNKSRAEEERYRQGIYVSYIDELSREIPVMLRLLKALDYPLMVYVTVTDRLLGFKKRNVIKAAWEIGSWEFSVPRCEGPMHTPLYLLSDGRLFAQTFGLHTIGPYGAEPFWPGNMSKYNAGSSLAGLRELRLKLEGMKGSR